MKIITTAAALLSLTCLSACYVAPAPYYAAPAPAPYYGQPAPAYYAAPAYYGPPAYLNVGIGGGGYWHRRY